MNPADASLTAEPVPGGNLVTAEVVRPTPDGPRLVGSRCLGGWQPAEPAGRVNTACAAVSFPAQASCPRCTGTDTAELLLPPTGTLWSFTVQAFAPKSPYLAADGPPAPFGVGYVDLGEVLVEARLVATTAEDLALGMAMELVIVPFAVSATGVPQLTHAFAPAPTAEAGR